MTLGEILSAARVVEERLAKLLDDDGKRAIGNAVRSLETQATASAEAKGRYGKRWKEHVQPWQLTITPGLPLSFQKTRISDKVRHRLLPDIACKISEPVDGIPSGEHNVVIRLWSDEEHVWFREGIDSEHLRHHIGVFGRRVMQRYHFDFANEKQPGPVFHLQVGGVQADNEHCWYPSGFELPRFVHHPVCLLLACEFVVKTFFPEEYPKLAREPMWSRALRVAQREYLVPYFERIPFLAATPGRADESCLDSVWNI